MPGLLGTAPRGSGGPRRIRRPNPATFQDPRLAQPWHSEGSVASEIEAVRADLAQAYRRRLGWVDGAAAGSHPEIARRQRAQQAVWLALRDVALAVDGKRRWAAGHAERVAVLARRLAGILGLAPDDVLLVERAALLHDIGKAAARPCTRELPGAAAGSGDVHPLVGALLVAPFGFLARAAPMIRHHHERWDGHGHPDGLRGTTIPLGARIIAAADAYDAQCYRTGTAGPAVAERLAGQAGRRLDPAILDALRSAVDTPESPP